MNVCVTGIGCISPLGADVDTNLSMLRAAKDGLGHSKYLNSAYSSEKFFGEVDIETKRLAEMLNLESHKGLTRTDLFAFKAFREAVASAGLTANQISSTDTAFISASTVGGMCLTDELYRDSNLQTEQSDFVDSYSCAAHTLKIVEFYSIKGISNTINTACSSSANAIMFGMRLIRTGRVKRAIVGGVDSLAKYTVNGFNSLQILSGEKCKPFDINRKGLNLGEAAAYLVLEAEDVCGKKTKLAKVIGAGNTNDAYHTSSMSDNAVGVTLCIQEALLDAGISPEQVDYINAHGTGTQNNDIVEMTGFKNVFKKVPPFSSTKSYTGHTLGAAGALEAVFSILSISNKEIYPSLNITESENAYGFSPERNYLSKIELKYVLSNSYGFGGNCTSLIFAG